MDKPVKCKCGADARVRDKRDTIWVECKKKCGLHSGYFHYDNNNPILTESIATECAIIMWNRVVCKSTQW